VKRLLAFSLKGSCGQRVLLQGILRKEPDVASVDILDMLQERARAKGLPLPMVAMTANALAQDWVNCLPAGMNDCLTKPIETLVLHEVVLRWVVPKWPQA
jgi:CheY-like chemotaxis protein